MAGKHRPMQPGRRPVELVDARTKQAHLLTLTAYEAGFDPHVAYVALWGAEVLPACLTESGKGYCRPCRSQINPQRSRITAQQSRRWWSR